MKMSFSWRRMGAYHMVVASFVPWMRNQGRGGPSTGCAMPASRS